MAKTPYIKKPDMPHASDDTTGPNYPGSVDPGFKDEYRDKGGDVAKPGDYAGRTRMRREDWRWRIWR